MKHLKTYENGFHPTTKKFSIFKYKNVSDSGLFVIEFLHYMNKDSAVVKLYYRYKIEGNELLEEDQKQFTLYNLHNYETLMESDNLEDCLNYIEKVKDSNKYNL